MQITETGVAAATNVEDSDNSVLCKTSAMDQDPVFKENLAMADVVSASDGTINGSNVIDINKCDTATMNYKDSQVCFNNLEVEVDDLCNKNSVLENENRGVSGEINGSETVSLDQADTTSVENLSIVTVVEKDLEITLEANQSSNNVENLNGHCECFQLK